MKPYYWIEVFLKSFSYFTLGLVYLTLEAFVFVPAQANPDSISSSQGSTQQNPQDCQKLLSPSWHPMAEFYGKKGFPYKSAMKRFGIHHYFQDTHSGLKPKEKVSLFFQEMEKTYTNPLTDENLKQQLKDQWLQRAVIEALPDSYIAFLQRRDLELGRDNGDLDLDKILTEIREAQKSSFSAWFNYIMSEDMNVPGWMRYVLLEDLLKTGVYNGEKKNFSLRTQDTANPYPDLNRKALHKAHGVLANYYTNNTEQIGSQDMDLLLRESNPSRMFGNLYGYYLHHYTNATESFDLQITQGQWMKFEQGDEGQAQALFDSLQGQGTGWCVAGSCSTIQNYLNKGDFYVYYSQDVGGKPTIPRIGIARDNTKSQITEIRGRDSDQNLDHFISESGVLDEKLLEFGNEGAEYFKKASDMRKLTEIYETYSRGDELSREDLRFLYEIDKPIEGFGYEKPERIGEIISKRDLKSDVAWALGLRREQVSLTTEEALSGGIVYHYGDLELPHYTNVKGLENLSYIRGRAHFRSLTNARGLENLKYIGRDAIFTFLTNARGLENLKYIGRDAIFTFLTNARGLENLKYIGRDAFFDFLRNPGELKNISYIGGRSSFAFSQDPLTHSTHFMPTPNRHGLTQRLSPP